MSESVVQYVQTESREVKADQLLHNFDDGNGDMDMTLFCKIYGPEGYNSRRSARPHIGKRNIRTFKSNNGRDCVSNSGVPQDKAMNLEFSIGRVIGRKDLCPRKRLKELIKAKQKYRTKDQ